MPPVRVGDRAPDFTLDNQDGQPVTPGRLGRPVVLYFYPKDETPGCTAEACSFRDTFADLRAAGADVFGISSDSVASHSQFATRHGLPFTLLSDPGGRVRSLFGVPRSFGLLPGRVTYVLDADGVVRGIFASQLAAARHASEALRILRELGPSPSTAEPPV